MVSPEEQNQVAAVRALFSRGRSSDGLVATEQLVRQGCINLDLLEQAWQQAIALNNADFMARVQASIKKVAPRARHWRLSMLQASYHDFRHEWHEKIVALRKARKQGADAVTIQLKEADARERLLQPEKALMVLEHFTGTGLALDHAQAIRARCLQQQGELQNAIELLESWLPEAGENVATVAGQKLLARLYDKTGLWKRAWEWAEAGNALSAKLYNSAIGDSDIRWRVEVWHYLYRPDSTFQLPEYDYDGATPVFLLGFPRSGTTLLEQVLDAHPSIQALEEPPTITLALQHAVDIAKARAWVRGTLKQPGLNKKQLLIRVFQEMAQFTEKEVERLRECYWESVESLLGKRPKQQILLDKMPLNTVDIAFIKMLFPEARFIVALRHPADVLLSCYMQSFSANDAMANFHELESGAVFYRQVMGLLERYQSKLSLSGRFHFIRYEDLTGNFNSETRKLMEFLDLPFEVSQQNYHEHARQRGTLATPSYQGVTQPIYHNAVGRWQHYTHWMHPTYDHLAPACLRYGYSLDRQHKDGPDL